MLALVGLCQTAIPAPAAPTTANTGGTGLLQVPSARLAAPDTLAAGHTWTPLHRHDFLTLQALPGVEATMRRTTTTGTGVPPSDGLDLKLRLLREDADQPELSIGVRGLFRSGGQAAQYLVMSRRWFDTDWTLGFGWGRFAQDGAFGLPVALIGGVEIGTPIDGLSLKIDHTGDLYRAERAANPRLSRPFPVNAGLAWRPLSWLELGAGIERGDTAMLSAVVTLGARALDEAVSGEPSDKAGSGATTTPLGPRPARSSARAAERSIQAVARSQGFAVRAVTIDDIEATAWLDAVPDGPPARAVGRLALIMARRAPAEVERLTVVLGPAELNGTAVSLARTDLERASRHAGSPSEIWRTTELRPAALLEAPPRRAGESWTYRVTPRLEIDPAGRSGSRAYRAALDASVVGGLAGGLVTGGGLRFNLDDNLASRLGERDQRLPVVRSDLARYADGVSVTADHLYTAWLWTPFPDWHVRAEIGHLDEMFGGWEGEVLYRPFGARWAVGLDADWVSKRVPGNLIHFEDQDYASTLASFHYESGDGLTHGTLRAGRYLAGDIGATLELSRTFGNGVSIAAHATVTNAGAESLDQGISLRIPLGPIPAIRRVLAPEFAVRTLGRDAGQRVDQPLRLYDVTGRSSVGRVIGGWDHLLD
ncbi:hypothetical protein N825_31590 [Skermanella stibiiresistens SB22]|uniref:Exopolysaccharide biosynthesis protein YbjH n=2 Tax=Skermanella TaxID=204447 RepID=W9H960_9PROT|nr:hypothetical protein N825_31590 [Skermanella stibiiresistens SB22]